MSHKLNYGTRDILKQTYLGFVLFKSYIWDTGLTKEDIDHKPYYGTWDFLKQTFLNFVLFKSYLWDMELLKEDLSR